jgi:hypothetical protein
MKKIAIGLAHNRLREKNAQSIFLKLNYNSANLQIFGKETKNRS